MLLKDVLLRIKTLQPNLQEVFLKSDNAGCYHSLQLMAFIWKNNSLFDLQVKEYNFSEVQSGKDLCDSRTGTCRMHVLKFANEGNNIENPADLKRALESNKGVRNTFVTLVDISVENPPVLIGTIKHFKISKMSNFVFEDQGIRVYQAFGIGSGYLITNTILEKISRNLSYDESRIKIIEEPCEHGEETFNLRPTKLKLNNSVEHGDLSCTIPGCVKSFRKPSTLEQHLAIGQHIYHENDKITDVAMEVWAEKCTHGTNINYNEQQDEDNIVIGADFMDMPSNLKSGWALKSERKFVRFKASVKDYIKQIFDEGERTGKKANPLTVANKIRNEKNDAGGRLFAPDDWVSAQQVRGVFASLQLKLQKQNPEHPGLELNLKTEVDDDLNEVLTELDAIETLNIVDSVTEQIS
ncbi:uncharacterized protein LOC127721237 [Mytilus californianus]|nr:uncharacterized protein LOC127721237 [Mytilus californianus]